MNQNQADFIKKTKVKYLNCKQGGHHEGQVLNFICIDSNCKKKGLICPVCQTTSHVNHQALHLKIFLSQIHKNLLNDSSQKQFLSLSEQLRKIQMSKKQMQKVLKQMVVQVSQKVKQIEQKINHSYLSLRKILLSQATISSKLPQLYHLLSGEGQNQDFIITQLNKFSQFLEYKNNKIHVIDNAQKLIEEYSKTANSVAIHLSTILPQISKKIENLPFKIKSLSSIDSKQQIKNSFKFSQTQKNSQVILSNNNKTVQLKQEGLGILLCFLKDQEQHNNIQKVSFKLKKCINNTIIIGIGNPQKYIQRNFIIDQGDCGDLFALTAMGFPLNDFDNPSFVFGQGDIIDIQWNYDQTKLTFSRRNGIQKFDLFPMITSNKNKQKLFVALSSKGDMVQIVQ